VECGGYVRPGVWNLGETRHARGVLDRLLVLLDRHHHAKLQQLLRHLLLNPANPFLHPAIRTIYHTGSVSGTDPGVAKLQQLQQLLRNLLLDPARVNFTYIYINVNIYIDTYIYMYFYIYKNIQLLICICSV